MPGHPGGVPTSAARRTGRRPHRLAGAAAALLLACTGVAPARADFEAGAFAYQRGNLAAAAKELKPLAENGDAFAQYLLGAALANAKPPLLDLAAAETWLGKAAAQGNVAAMRDLGQVNLFQKKPADRAAAEKWLLAAGNRGDAQSQHLLGVMYLDAEGSDRKPAEAYKWLLLAAQRGHLLSALLVRLERAPFGAQDRDEGARLAAAWQPIP